MFRQQPQVSQEVGDPPGASTLSISYNLDTLFVGLKATDIVPLSKLTVASKTRARSDGHHC
jgi:hypothetical protein